MDARGKDKDACETVRMNVELVREDGLWFGRLGRLDVVPAEAPIGTFAGRLGQSDRYGRMNEPRSNCSERPDLHAGWLQWTDPQTRAHQKRPGTWASRILSSSRILLLKDEKTEEEEDNRVEETSPSQLIEEETTNEVGNRDVPSPPAVASLVHVPTRVDDPTVAATEDPVSQDSAP
ncbi:hypothetical protein F2Q69_00048313 [Brassica cretica]|uniref:Uncharacterized protein n=1 Tax=Brassica cretica TaxID=69181 RepID=A0A8S9PTK8_BRACR|nr:hypothetical protein F2Q69_00048313 [Brassica cretica]